MKQRIKDYTLEGLSLIRDLWWLIGGVIIGIGLTTFLGIEMFSNMYKIIEAGKSVIGAYFSIIIALIVILIVASTLAMFILLSIDHIFGWIIFKIEELMER